MPKIVHNLWQPSPLSSPFPGERVRVRDGGFRGHPPDVSWIQTDKNGKR